LVHPAGLPPADSPFEAEDDNNFTTDAEMEPMERLALSWGKCARQFTKLLLSLLSHIGKWWAISMKNLELGMQNSGTGIGAHSLILHVAFGTLHFENATRRRS